MKGVSNPPLPAGVTLPDGYAEITSNVTSTVNFASPEDAAGLSITVTTDGRPVLLSFFTPELSNSSAGDRCVVRLRNGTGTEYVSVAPISTAANDPHPCSFSARVTPAAGEHTFKILISRVAAGTAKIAATATNKAYLRAAYDA